MFAPPQRSSRGSAVSVRGVSKSFRVYQDRNQSLKATILRRKRASFEEFWALRDVSLEIPEGRTFGLMGHNGSGKSTLLKCIARILEPNEGSITARGRMAAMLEVGSGFHPELSGRENVYLNGSILGMSRAEIDRKFDTIVDFAGVEAFIDQPVKNYSSGMYVRLGFSVAIHVDPEILLVDEILAVGDMQFQEKCREKFAEFKDQGRTVIVVSHGLGEMRTFCDEAAWLDHGRLVEVGPAVDIVDNYIEAGHLARPVASGGMRHGSGEVIVERIELLDRDDEDTRQFRTGEPLTMRLHYRATERIERPVFAASLHSRDGQHLWSHHTWDAQYIPSAVSGSGSIDVAVPALPLQPGSFTVNTSVVDEELAHSYDQWVKAVQFDVVPGGTPRESGGVLVMQSTWRNLLPTGLVDPATSAPGGVPVEDHTGTGPAAPATTALSEVDLPADAGPDEPAGHVSDRQHGGAQDLPNGVATGAEPLPDFGDRATPRR
ncbi:ABC transporter ATP-binding protein [Nakamurella sp. YIM 132084]|uniref:ABC transporter ATP-binding protein n=1 Tax=Nakamurella leprariae TaxID=2803911 RepID=A0A939BWM7_9ACTN|nr:ABC transporter ATP-binding protein [Nakamurella leprariae]